VDALVLRHYCSKIDGDAHSTISDKDLGLDHGLCFLTLWRYKAYADSRRGSLFADEVVSNESAVVENATFLFRSLYLYIFPIKFPTGFTYRND